MPRQGSLQTPWVDKDVFFFFLPRILKYKFSTSFLLYTGFFFFFFCFKGPFYVDDSKSSSSVASEGFK